jgi:hypothetical protein
MDVCVVKRRLWTVRDKKDEKGLIQNKNGSNGKTQELVKKKKRNPTGGMDVCLL